MQIAGLGELRQHGAARSVCGGWHVQGDEMQQLAEQVARLADVAERLFAREQAREQQQRADQLRTRRPPQRAGLATYLRAIPGLAARFDRTVPDSFIAQTAEHQYEIACPCGQTPTLARGQLRGCDCGRWFLHDGVHIHVASAPGSPEAAPASGEPTPS